jgi:hypothetical protein
MLSVGGHARAGFNPKLGTMSGQKNQPNAHHRRKIHPANLEGNEPERL